MGNKEITLFLTCAAWIAFYFPTDAVDFITLSFSIKPILTFFINHALNIKYPPWNDKG
jgi:hypothetical protein